MGYYAAGAGMTEAGIATLFAASEQDKRLHRISKIADTPGIDTGALSGQALGDQLRYLPLSEQLASQISAANQGNLNAQEEANLPGVGAARQKALAQINSLFGSDAEWLKGVQRRGAALGIGRGLGGSQAAQIGELKLSDTEQMARTQLGTGLLGSLIGSMRIANTPGVQAFLGPTPEQLINLRSQERTQRMNILLGREQLPTGNEQIFQHMQQEGGALIGAGLGGGNAFSSPSGAAGSSGQNPNQWSGGSAPSSWGGIGGA